MGGGGSNVVYGMLNVALFDVLLNLLSFIFFLKKSSISILSLLIFIVYFPLIFYISSFVFINFHYYFSSFVSIVYFNICIGCLAICIYLFRITILSPLYFFSILIYTYINTVFHFYSKRSNYFCCIIVCLHFANHLFWLSKFRQVPALIGPSLTKWIRRLSTLLSEARYLVS